MSFFKNLFFIPNDTLQLVLSYLEYKCSFNYIEVLRSIRSLREITNIDYCVTIKRLCNTDLLRQICSIPFINRLQLSSCDTIQDLRMLSYLKHLSHLDLQNYNREKKEDILPIIANIITLDTLKLNRYIFSINSIETYLFPLSRLMSLTLVNENQPIILPKVCLPPQLRSLTLTAFILKDAVLSNLSQLSSLSICEFMHSLGPLTQPELKGSEINYLTVVRLPLSLTSLTLNFSNVNNIHLEQISILSSLTYLDISHSTMVNKTGLVYLSFLPLLSTLICKQIHNCNYTSILSKVTYLDVSETDITHLDISLFPQLTTLNISGCRFIRVNFIFSLTSLTQLDMSSLGKEGSNLMLQNINLLTNLTHLFLINNFCIMDYITKIASLTKLQVLKVASTNIDIKNKHLQEIAKLTNLTELDLRFFRPTSHYFLDILLPLTKLKRLKLSKYYVQIGQRIMEICKQREWGDPFG
jgi:hypothetical protein